MQHTLALTGKAFSLRPVCDADAQAIVDLRTDPALNAFINATSASLEAQLTWLHSYYTRQNDYYFAIIRNGCDTPEGFVSLYNIDTAAATGEWGRWIIRRGSLAAVESAHLVYSCAFARLGLSSVYCHTLAGNSAVVSFHDSCNTGTRVLLPAHVQMGGRPADIVEHRMTAQDWPALDTQLGALAARIATRLLRGAQGAA